MKANLKRVYRLWKQEKLTLSHKRPCRKRVKPLIGIMQKATCANQVWTYDFVFDQSLSGKILKMLTLIDESTRECLAIEVGVSITSRRVREILQRVCAGKGKPERIRSDNGSEFIGKAVGGWLGEKGINPLFIEPGKPWQNGKCESFNGELRGECLNREWFSSVKEAQVVIEGWRKFYNEGGPHSSLGYLTPNEFKLQAESNKYSRHSIGITNGAAQPRHNSLPW